MMRGSQNKIKESKEANVYSSLITDILAVRKKEKASKKVDRKTGSLHGRKYCDSGTLPDT